MLRTEEYLGVLLINQKIIQQKNFFNVLKILIF